MRFEIRDTYGDPITVAPLEPDLPGVPLVIIRFTTADEDADDGTRVVDMVLNDRQVIDLKTALRRSIKESERIG